MGTSDFAFFIDIITLIFALFVTPMGTSWRRLLLALVGLSIVVALFPGTLATFGYFLIAFTATAIAALSIRQRRIASNLWLSRVSDPIVLSPPFVGTWKVLAGGADPRYNHHQRVQDQYFAYDFGRMDKDTWDSEIVAPCDGAIAHIEDWHEDAAPNRQNKDLAFPAGNYVAVRTQRGYIILAHLRQHSIMVRDGAVVRAGDVIARCGNSGNTTLSHLHLHAQDKPRVAPFTRANGIPVAFTDDASDARILKHGDTLNRSGFQPNSKGYATRFMRPKMPWRPK